MCKCYELQTMYKENDSSTRYLHRSVPTDLRTQDTLVHWVHGFDWFRRVQAGQNVT